MFIPYNNGNTKMEFPTVNPHDVSGNIGAGECFYLESYKSIAIIAFLLQLLYFY